MRCQPLTPEQLKTFFDSFNLNKEQDRKKYLFYQFLYYTGLRISDACNFRKSYALQIINDGFCEYLEIKKKNILKKLNKVPKKSDYKMIYNHAKLDLCIRQSLDLFDDKDFLFHLYDESNFRHYNNKKSVELGFHIGNHSFRKSHGVRLFELTQNMSVVQRALCHNDIKTTQLYVPTIDFQLRSAYNLF